MTSQQPRAINMAQLTNQCIDPNDISDFFDFNQITSPAVDSSKGRLASQASTLTSPTTTFQSIDITDDSQPPMQPSHDYTRFRQQAGLPTQADHLRLLGQSPDIFQYSNSGIYENSQAWDNPMGMSDVSPDLNFSAFLESLQQPDDVIDPNAILKQEEAQAQVRYYPGMHQQAAAAKQKQAQMQKEREEQQRAARRSASHQPRDPRTEETISRVMDRIRRDSTMVADGLSPTGSGGVLPHIIRSKREEDDMDEDERLLNSEEGKKLSSKERRQLRNKVSARAFRSRRKEYIGQLEGEVAAKTNEANELKRQNHALMEENARFRALAEKLLAHQAFHPFLEELSRDRALAESLSKVATSSVTPQTPQLPKDIDPYASSAHFMPQGNNDSIVGMTLVPEVPVDLSSLNIGSESWVLPLRANQTLQTFQTPHVYAVTEVPLPPAPIEISSLSGKEESCFPELRSEKTALPEIQAAPIKESDVEPECEIDESDPTMILFARTKKSAPKNDKVEPLFGEMLFEKAFARYELVVNSAADDEQLAADLEMMCAKMDACMRKLDALSG